MQPRLLAELIEQAECKDFIKCLEFKPCLGPILIDSDWPYALCY